MEEIFSWIVHFAGVAVGSGWQAYVAWINIFCYYIIGLPIGAILGWGFNLGTWVN